MPERSEYAPGTPCWIDIGTDVEGAKKFYGALLGWTTQDAGPPEETGGYGFFFKNGKMVAGYGPQQSPGPPFWSTYVWVTDADETAKKVEAAGGTVVVGAMDVMSAGRMAVFQDPQGGFISVWQPGDHKGAQLVNEPGSFCWNELNSRDVEGSKEFYQAVFGWEPVSHEGGPMPYTEWHLGGTSIGGMLSMPPNVPAAVPTFWLVYFAVDDTDAAVAKAQELGGSVSAPPMDIPSGRFAVLTDPQGAVFGVIKLAA
jgi:predicted enzyme related to lactoylglutathione lyase